MAKRMLTPEEKNRIAEERRGKEASVHSNKMISVRVEDETDEQGEPIVLVHYIGESQSKDWKRNAEAHRAKIKPQRAR
jgi:hypothetical protein